MQRLIACHMERLIAFSWLPVQGFNHIPKMVKHSRRKELSVGCVNQEFGEQETKQRTLVFSNREASNNFFPRSQTNQSFWLVVVADTLSRECSRKYLFSIKTAAALVWMLLHSEIRVTQPRLTQSQIIRTLLKSSYSLEPMNCKRCHLPSSELGTPNFWSANGTSSREDF